MFRNRLIRRAAAAALALFAALAVAPVKPAGSSVAVVESAAAVPAGFSVTPYAELPAAPTSLAFGPDGTLYVTLWASGQVAAVRQVAGAPVTTIFAGDLAMPLGVVVDSHGTVFASDAEPSRDGPFGVRRYGRVWRLRDTNGDGAADVREVVLKDLPNGRHNTNGLAFGRDGMLYVANGNATDDGVEGGNPGPVQEVPPWSGSVLRVDPAATDVSVTSLSPSTAVVATGMRNVYDLAFSPVRPFHLFLPTNGVDEARPDGANPLVGVEDSDDLLYITDTEDVAADGSQVIDDFGFPSCLYNLARQGNLEPYDNPHPDVIARFGHCPTATVPRPAATFGLHPSADGLAFQSTGAWGPELQNDLFVALFGNFFGEPAGHKVVRVELDGKGRNVTGVTDFLVGITPLDLTFDQAGNMFVADFSGTIFKVAKL